MSRHASFTFRDSGLGIFEIATRLGAQYLVTGSVQRRGERLRVAAALATADGRQVWSETFEVDFVAIQTSLDKLANCIGVSADGKPLLQSSRTAAA